MKAHDDKAREREQFEEWASDYGLFPRAVERNAEGSYKLMKTATDWITWQAARAALSPASGQEMTDEQIATVYRKTFPVGPYLITADVYRFARALLAATAQQVEAEKWISVTERLPEFYEEVMIWPHPNDMCMTAELRKDGNWIYGEYVQGHGWSAERMPRPPTHWRPLPAPPSPNGISGDEGVGK